MKGAGPHDHFQTELHLSASDSDLRLGDPSIPNLASHHVEQQPSTVTEFRNIRLLALGYLGMSMLSIFATVVLRNHASEVDSAVWTRGVIVALSATRHSYWLSAWHAVLGSVPPAADHLRCHGHGHCGHRCAPRHLSPLDEDRTERMWAPPDRSGDCLQREAPPAQLRHQLAAQSIHLGSDPPGLPTNPESRL